MALTAKLRPVSGLGGATSELVSAPAMAIVMPTSIQSDRYARLNGDRPRLMLCIRLFTDAPEPG
jgi:hypothetical protein